MSEQHPGAAPDKEKMYGVTQEETGYVTLSSTDGQACANCRWFKSQEWYPDGSRGGAACHLVMSYPLDILPTGWCNRWEAIPEQRMKPEPLEVIVVDEVEDDEMEGEMSYGAIAPAVWAEKRAGLQPGSSIFKDSAGRRYMFMVTSNAYKDRDKERMLRTTLENYVEALWTADNAHFLGGETQSHYIWHAKELGSVSDLVFADLWHGFLVEVWREKDTPLAHGFYNFVERHPEITHGASHGFRYRAGDRTKEGEYTDIAKYESSTLPLNAAANLLTFSGVVSMKTRNEYLKQLLNEEFGVDIDPAELQNNFAAVADKLAQVGITQKAAGSSAAPDATLAKAFLRLAEDVADQGEELAALKAAQSAKAADGGTAVADLKTQVAQLTAQLKEMGMLRPRADEAPETALDGDAVDQIKKQLKPVEYDPFFADMKIQKGE